MRYWLLGGMTVILIALLWGQRATPLNAAEGLTFTLNQPTHEQAITGRMIPIEVSFASTADAPVVRFDAYLDKTWILGGTISNPMATGRFAVDATLDGITAKPGPHTLYVKLYTSLGNVAQRAQKILLAPDGMMPDELTPPTVRITEPKSGQQISGNTLIRVQADDNTGIKLIMLYINGKLRAMMNEPPYVMPWNPIQEKFAAGEYTLTARAFDLFDNEGTSAPVTVTVTSVSTGRTPIETTRPPASLPDIPGVLPTETLQLPSAGESLERSPLSSLPIAQDWASAIGLLLPTPPPPAPRAYLTFSPSGEPLALLPMRVLPGREDTGDMPTLVAVGVSSAPALPAAATPSRPDFTPERLGGAPARFTDLPRGTAVPPTLGATQPSERTIAPTAPTASGTPPAFTTPSKAAPAPAASDDPFPQTSAHPAHPASAPSAPVLIAKAPPTASLPTPHHTTPSVMLPQTVGLPTQALTPERTPSTTAPQIQPKPVTAPKLVPTVSDGTIAPVTPVRVATVDAPAAPVKTVARDVEVRGPYTVKPGDTLEKIARLYSSTPDELKKLNPGLTPQQMAAETRIVVPRRDIRVYLDEKPLACTPQPYITQGYTMVPFRKLVEAKDGTVVWLAPARTVNAWANGAFMSFQIGKREAQLNAQPYLLPVAPTLREDRAMAPLRYVATALDLHVEYNTATGSYYLVSRTTP